MDGASGQLKSSLARKQDFYVRKCADDVLIHTGALFLSPPISCSAKSVRVKAIIAFDAAAIYISLGALSPFYGIK